MYKTYMGKVKREMILILMKYILKNWMIEDEDEFLLLYWTQPQTGYGALFNDSELVDGHGPICHIMVYRDKKGKYYLCIKREGNDLY